MRARLRHSVVALTGLACALLAATGCNLLTVDQPSGTQPGIIFQAGDSADVTFPDTVDVNTNFVVGVKTFGGGCIREAAGTQVAVDSGIVQIQPSDRWHGLNGCPDDALMLDHQVSVRAAVRGPTTLQIIGLSRLPDDSFQLAVLELPIYVR